MQQIALTAMTPTVVLMRPTRAERGYAELAIHLLREAGVADEDITAHHTKASPRADAAMEAWYHEETGEHIRAGVVKAEMRRMVCQ